VHADDLRALLDSLRRGVTSVEEAFARLATMPFEDLGFAKLDHHRGIRCGFPEVVFGDGKTREQVLAIFERCAAGESNVLATRVAAGVAEAICTRFGEAVYHADARAVTLRRAPRPRTPGGVVIVSAGTSDRPVAEEARVTCDILDLSVQVFQDVGVAGLHRLTASLDAIRAADVVIAVAGMEGALPSVVGGMVACPVVAVPTSVGYGVGFRGLAALMAMLNSCASGVTVVNIDNGFGAACAAARILNRASSVEA